MHAQITYMYIDTEYRLVTNTTHYTLIYRTVYVMHTKVVFCMQGQLFSTGCCDFMLLFLSTKPTFLLTHLTHLWLPLQIHEYVEHVYNAMDNNHYNVVNTVMVRCHKLIIVMYILVFKWNFQEEVLIELFAVSY